MGDSELRDIVRPNAALLDYIICRLRSAGAISEVAKDSWLKEVARLESSSPSTKSENKSLQKNVSHDWYTVCSVAWLRAGLSPELSAIPLHTLKVVRSVRLTREMEKGVLHGGRQIYYYVQRRAEHPLGETTKETSISPYAPSHRQQYQIF